QSDSTNAPSPLESPCALARCRTMPALTYSTHVIRGGIPYGTAIRYLEVQFTGLALGAALFPGAALPSRWKHSAECLVESAPNLCCVRTRCARHRCRWRVPDRFRQQLHVADSWAWKPA